MSVVSVFCLDRGQGQRGQVTEDRGPRLQGPGEHGPGHQLGLVIIIDAACVVGASARERAPRRGRGVHDRIDSAERVRRARPGGVAAVVDEFEAHGSEEQRALRLRGRVQAREAAMCAYRRVLPRGPPWGRRTTSSSRLLEGLLFLASVLRAFGAC